MDYANSYVSGMPKKPKRIYGRTIPANTPNKNIIVKKFPVGVVGAITPWNFPAAMITRKIAPALAAGCTIVCKPATQTPLTTIRLIELAHRRESQKMPFNMSLCLVKMQVNYSQNIL